MLFRQLFDRESCTWTYLLADTESNEALLIDPVLEHVERDAKLVAELGLSLKYCLNTHCHADHVSGSGKLKKTLEGCQSVLGAEGNEEAAADIKVAHGDELTCGSIRLHVLHTPGHTAGCHCFVVEDGPDRTLVFTGDVVLVRGCGRTDFQGGSSKALYESVHKHVFSLPDRTIICPAHDYKGHTASTVGEEKQFNPRLTKTLAEFVDIMDNLGLAYPKMIDVALPANLRCGIQE